MSSNFVPKPFLRTKWPRFDRAVWLTVLALCSAIALILWHGPQTASQVSYFSWAGKKIGVHDRYFSLTFDRPVDRLSVAENLVIEPSLPGKISWSGNQLVYTLTELPIYGTKYQVRLEGIRERFSQENSSPFIGVFHSHDRAFVYIGVQEEERGRLILGQIIQDGQKIVDLKKTILTPGDLIVTRFKIYPEGDKILFSAFEPFSGGLEVPKQQLYTVTTGLNFKATENSARSGRIQRIVDAQTYQNLQFDLSSNGQAIVVQRVNHHNPADAGLWIILDDGELKPLGIRGDEFLLSPDGQKLAVSQPGGVAILPLTADGGSPQFLPGYERILGFSRDSQQQIVVKANFDYSRSLYVIDGQNRVQGLFRTINSILGCQFEPRQEKTLYCLKTDLVIGDDNRIKEEPYLAIVDIATSRELPLLSLPNSQDVEMSLSPDGLALLFDQVVTIPTGGRNELSIGEGQAIANGQLWLLPLPQALNFNNPPKISPKELNAGFKPRWIP